MIQYCKCVCRRHNERRMKIILICRRHKNHSIQCNSTVRGAKDRPGWKNRGGQSSGRHDVRQRDGFSKRVR